ncbi:hypothetical protein LIER_09059 [Lithospermum erythrorhizon]|uniref:RNase H type-1 domain-containing protein n=1 Tax=Lithospermum erythrorhizon TaxID=34254 RepID=A0AAV3PGG9_LITER
MRILNTYEEASEQRINVDKRSVSFDFAASTGTRREVMEILGMREVTDQGKYLGPPSYIGKTKRDVFSFLSSKIVDKLHGTIDNLNSSVEKFFWGSAYGDKGIHWKAWDKLCEERFEGGLGFKDLECMNLAYLLNKGPYFRRTSFIHAKLGANPSFAWRSLLEGQKVLLKGLQWQVGDDRSIDMWKEPWVPRNTNFFLRCERGENPRWVSQLIRDGCWIRELVEEVMDSDDAHKIFALPLSRRGMRDKMKARNIKLFEDQVVSFDSILKHGMTLDSDYQKAMEQRIKNEGSQKADQSAGPPVCWIPPDINFIKVNCDVGWRSEDRADIVGIACRDASSRFRGAFFKQLQWVVSPLIAEGHAAREALQFAWKQNFSHVELESDSKQLILMLQGKQRIQVEVEVIIEDIKYLAKFMEVKFRNVKRTINNVAHEVADWDHNGVLEPEWFSTPPNWFYSALFKDLSS